MVSWIVKRGVKREVTLRYWISRGEAAVKRMSKTSALVYGPKFVKLSVVEESVQGRRCCSGVDLPCRATMIAVQ